MTTSPNSPTALRITPKFNIEPVPLTHSWAGVVNIDQFKWLSWSAVHGALDMARKEIGAHTVRAVGMYGFANRVYDADPRGFKNPEHRGKRSNFSMLNTYFDGCIERGVTPMFTTCFTPDVLAKGDKTVFDQSGNVTPPRDMDEWEQFVELSVREMAHRYGRRRMREWLFEVWNEPNLEGGFWVGGQELWMEVWRRSFRAIKNVDADFRVGGPSTARGEWVGDLLDYGKSNDCLPDYIITHCYNNDADGDAALSPFDGPQTDKISKSPNFASGVIRGVKSICDSKNFTGEIHWNEWGRSWFPWDPERETENEAAFIWKTMAEVGDQADSFAYWNLSDIYNQVGYGRETFHANYGMLNQQNIRKPNYLAHQLLCRLKENRYGAEVQGGSDLVNSVCAGNEETRQVGVYAFQAPEGEAIAPRRVEIALEASEPFHRPKLFRITRNENNAVRRWEEAGSEPYMSPEDSGRWKDSSALREAPLSDIDVRTEGDARIVSFTLEGRGVAFLEWHREGFTQPMK
ncbi:MAG: hypothetical protein WD708_03575 [Kiritimatiellia bacterium]